MKFATGPELRIRNVSRLAQPLSVASAQCVPTPNSLDGPEKLFDQNMDEPGVATAVAGFLVPVQTSESYVTNIVGIGLVVSSRFLETPEQPSKRFTTE